MKKPVVLRSAFSAQRVIALFLCSGGVLLGVLGLNALIGSSATAQNTGQAGSGAVLVGASYHNDISPAMRDVAAWSGVSAGRGGEREANENPQLPYRHRDSYDSRSKLACLRPRLHRAKYSSSHSHFRRGGLPGVGCNCAPPDTNGAVGLTQYVQSVNIAYQVFDKNTGASVLGPNSITFIWSGFGGVCQTGGKGDPVVLYDHLANRWLISQFAGSGSAVTDECVAISTTSDAPALITAMGFISARTSSTIRTSASGPTLIT
ncbi:MAG: hypothetical protein ABI016_14985 [Chthoniobacterales bacterium]